jgi:hypothetical protein
MRDDRRDRDPAPDDRWGLRSERASTAVSRFCLAWIDAGRDLGFGAAHLALHTAEDLSESVCPSPRDPGPAKAQPGTTQVETAEVRRRARRV